MIQKIKTHIENKRIDKVKTNLHDMIKTIINDKEHEPTMNDVYNITFAWLICQGHKKKYIDKVLNDHYMYMYNKAKVQLNKSVKDMENNA